MEMKRTISKETQYQSETQIWFLENINKIEKRFIKPTKKGKAPLIKLDMILIDT